MAGRIRSIKPDLFVHDELATLSCMHRLAFIGLWCFADREGRLKDKPTTLKVQILPYDACNFDEVLATLAAGGFIVRYEVDGQRLISIPSFLKHQVINLREAASKLPPPPESARTCMHVQDSAAHVQVRETHVHAHGEGKGRELEGKGREGVGNGPAAQHASETPPASKAAGETAPAVQASAASEPRSATTASGATTAAPVPTQPPSPANAPAAKPGPHAGNPKTTRSGVTSDDLKRLWEETRAQPGSGIAAWPEMPVGKQQLFDGLAGLRPLEGPTGWRAVVEKISKSSFCNGRGGTPFKASPDWILDVKHTGVIGKILAGNYDDGAGPAPKKSTWVDAGTQQHPTKAGTIEKL